MSLCGTIRSGHPVWRYLFRKVSIYIVTFVVAVSIDWAIPRFMPGDPIEGLLSRMQAQPQAVGGADGLLHRGVRVRRPALEAIRQLLGGSLPGRSRAQHHQFPDPCLGADHGRPAVHARIARPGDPAQLLGGEQGRRARSPPKDARQHRAPGGLRADRNPADVARNHPRLAVRLDPRPLPRLGRVRARRCSRSGRSSSRAASCTTGSCPSPPSSSSPSAAGPSGCGT